MKNTNRVSTQQSFLAFHEKLINTLKVYLSFNLENIAKVHMTGSEVRISCFDSKSRYRKKCANLLD